MSLTQLRFAFSALPLFACACAPAGESSDAFVAQSQQSPDTRGTALARTASVSHADGAPNAPAVPPAGPVDPGGGGQIIVDAPPQPAPPAQSSATACVGEIYKAERLPVDIYFLVDTSGSMAEPTPNGAKWALVSQALTAFLEEPSNAEMAVGIGYFPLGSAGTCVAGDLGCLCIPFTPLCVNLLGGSCEAGDYGQPSVPLALPPDFAPVVANLDAKGVSGGTPTRPALQGALDYAESWAREHPDRKTVVVLATDGEPTGCSENTPADVAAVAAAALPIATSPRNSGRRSAVFGSKPYSATLPSRPKGSVVRLILSWLTCASFPLLAQRRWFL